MADKNIAVKHIQRNDTRANWLTHNPILLKGEIGVEIDTFKIKIGNGVDNYATLPYLNTSLDRKIATQKVTALTDNQTEFDIPFEDYEEDRCYLDIRINSVWISPEKYTINGNKLVLKSGRKIGTEVFFTCHYLTYINQGKQRDVSTQKVVATISNQTEFNIPFDNFEKDNCFLEVRINSVWINPDKYTIREKTLVLNDGRKVGTEVFITCHYLKNYTYTESSSLIQKRLVELEEKSANEQIEKQKLIEEVRELKTLLMDYVSNK